MNGVPTIHQSLSGISDINIAGDVTAGTYETTTTGSFLSGINKNVQVQFNELKSTIGTGSQSWIFCGAYLSGTNYDVGNVVTYLHSTYVALLANSNQLPSNTTYWAMICTDGSQGAIGVTGHTGCTGAPGENGIQGSTGENGIQGATGCTGCTGATGEKGLQGATGCTGCTGATGEKGDQGVKGDQGDKGDKGSNGKDGTNAGDAGVVLGAIGTALGGLAFIASYGAQLASLANILFGRALEAFAGRTLYEQIGHMDDQIGDNYNTLEHKIHYINSNYDGNLLPVGTFPTTTITNDINLGGTLTNSSAVLAVKGTNRTLVANGDLTCNAGFKTEGQSASLCNLSEGSYFKVENSNDNLLKLKLKANPTNSLVDATILVTGNNPPTFLNSGIMSLFSSIVNLVSSNSKNSYIQFINSMSNLLTINFKANENNDSTSPDVQFQITGGTSKFLQIKTDEILETCNKFTTVADSHTYFQVENFHDDTKINLNFVTQWDSLHEDILDGQISVLSNPSPGYPRKLNDGLMSLKGNEINLELTDNAKFAFTTDASQCILKFKDKSGGSQESDAQIRVSSDSSTLNNGFMFIDADLLSVNTSTTILSSSSSGISNFAVINGSVYNSAEYPPGTISLDAFCSESSPIKDASIIFKAPTTNNNNSEHTGSIFLNALSTEINCGITTISKKVNIAKSGFFFANYNGYPTYPDVSNQLTLGMKAGDALLNTYDAGISVYPPIAPAGSIAPDFLGKVVMSGASFEFSHPNQIQGGGEIGSFYIGSRDTYLGYQNLLTNTVPSYTQFTNTSNALTQVNQQYIRFRASPRNTLATYDGYICCLNVPSTLNPYISPNDNGDIEKYSTGSIGIQASVVNIGNFADEIQIGTIQPGFGTQGYGTDTSTNWTPPPPSVYSPFRPQITNITIGNANSIVTINGTVNLTGAVNFVNHQQRLQVINELTNLTRSRSVNLPP